MALIAMWHSIIPLEQLSCNQLIPAFATTRVTWYRDMLDALYDAGGAGSNVWQLADWSDNDYNVNSYLPLLGVERDEGIMNVLSTTAKQIGQGDNNSWW